MSPAIPNQLQCQAHRDDPTCALAWADEAAWAKAEGHGSAAATEAIRRKDAEAWIPGLPARRTVMSMGWVIFFAVVAGGALSWAPDYAVVDWIAAALKIVAALAVVAAAWSILSEMRGWEGSDASGWLLKRRTKRFQKAFEARRGEIRDTLIAIGQQAITVYRIREGAIVSATYARANVEAITVEPTGSHMSLRVTTPADTMRFDWLPRDPDLEAAIGRFAAG